MKLKASTLVEFVLALTIMGVSFSVASYIFIQGNRSTIQFKEVKEQTEFQSLLFEAYLNDTLPKTKQWKGDLTKIEEMDSKKISSTEKSISLESTNKQLWKQQFYETK